jgi:hypothetical protein
MKNDKNWKVGIDGKQHYYDIGELKSICGIMLSSRQSERFARCPDCQRRYKRRLLKNIVVDSKFDEDKPIVELKGYKY